MAFFLAFSFLFGFAENVFALTQAEERTQLEQQLNALEQEISQIEGSITTTQKQKQTLQNQISLLKAKIKKIDLQVAQSNAIIGDLKSQIVDTGVSIKKTNSEIDTKKAQLSSLLMSIYREDKKGVVEVVLTGATLSSFFSNLQALESLQARNRDLLSSTIELSGYLQDQKIKLETEKIDEENFVKIQILQKQESQNLTAQNQQLLDITKGKETEYQKLLTGKQQAAKEIRSRMFDLTGVSQAPTFGEALEIAKSVSTLTGVRPAFLLAIITQESNLGKNVGQCYLKNPDTGSGMVISTQRTLKNVMKPSRDVQPFIQITQALERDPYATPVSCPIPSVGGWGGAMGPAQFIPSTWMFYASALEKNLGRPSDPWSIKDAFLASAMLLADSGASKQTSNAEWRAAMIYFSGGTNTRYRFYGDSALAITKQYEKDIKDLAE